MHHNYGWCAWPKENSDKQLFFSVSQWSNTIIFCFSCCAKNLSIVCESESRQQREVVTVQTSYHPEDDKLCLSFQDSVPLHIIKGKMIRRLSAVSLCRRMASPIIPHSWSGLVWKRISPINVITMVQSTTIFGMVTTTERRNNRVILLTYSEQLNK